MKKLILFTLFCIGFLTHCTKLSDISPNRNYQFTGVVLSGKYIRLPIALPNCSMKLIDANVFIGQSKSSEIILDSLNFTIESPSAFWFGAGKETLTLHKYESPLKITNGRIIYNNQDFGSINGDTLRLKIIPTAYFNFRNSHGEFYTVAKTSHVANGNEMIIDGTNGLKKSTKTCGLEMWYYNSATNNLRSGGTDFSQAEWVFIKK
jgi:hypothetical protein